MKAIEAVVDDLFARVAADPKLAGSFAGTAIPRTRRRLIEMICQAAGGPCTYSGRDMKTVHEGMGITSKGDLETSKLSGGIQNLRPDSWEQDWVGSAQVTYAEQTAYVTRLERQVALLNEAQTRSEREASDWRKVAMYLIDERES
jgi:hypothetical protein